MASNNVNEGIENQEKTKKKDPLELKQEFLSEFTKNKLEDNRVKYIDDVMSVKSITDKGLSVQLAEFQSKNLKVFGSLDLNSINIFNLRVSVSRDYLKLKTARNLFFSQVKKTYIIDETTIDKIIKNDSKGKEISEKKLYELINSPKKLEKFLKNEIPEIKTIKKENLFPGFGKLTEKEIEKRCDKNLTEDEKSDIKLIIFNLNNNNIKDIDIIDLFSYNFLTYQEKKSIIDVYIPVISLSQASKFGILKESEAKIKKKEVMTDLFKKLFNDNDLDEIILDDIIDNTSNDDIILKSKDLYNENNINLLADNIGFKNLEQDFLSLKEDVKKLIIKKGPQSFDDLVILLDEINNNKRFEKLEKLRKGSIIKYTTKDSDNKPFISYVEISSIDDKNNEFGYKVIGEGSHISLDSSNKIEEKKSYVDFLEGLKQKQEVRFECFTSDEIKKQIDDKQIFQNEFKEISSDDFNGEKKEDLEKTYINGLKDEIAILKQEIKDIEDNKIKGTEDKKTKEEKIKLLEQKKNINSDNDSLNAINKLRLIEKLDEVDPDGKNIGFGKGVFFEIDGVIFEVDGFTNIITLIHTKSNQRVDVGFNDFFTTFKEKKAKRIEKLENFPSLIEKSIVDNNKWAKHEICNGELVAKGVLSGGKTGDQVVEYLVGDKTNDLIKINNINGNQVKIQFGERKNYSDLDEGYKKKNRIGKDDKGETIFLDPREFTITLNDLDNYIKADKLHPNWETGKKIEPEKTKNTQNEIGGSFISRYFRRTSINELMAGGKMLVDGIKETLKKGNGLHAAEFAMRIGKILPGDLGEDMKIMVERAQEEQQGKELENLGKVDSWIAVERIEKWLKNKDTQEYKKEAGILFMLEKYGHLTAKGAMYKYRGKRLWYEALGGKINDKLFLEVKANAEASNITFSEENLIHNLLKKQCSGKLLPKRRSRLHKEFEGKWKSGVAAEFDKGYGDAEKKRTARDIADSGHGEADTGTTSNAIGWYKKAVERGGSLEEMSEGFFALLFSGSLYNVDQSTFLKIKGLWDGDGMPIIMTRFSTKVSDMKLFNSTVVEICKKIEENKYPEHEGIYKEAKDLFEEALSGKGSEGARYKKTINFWKKHGTPIARALNMANVADTKYSKTDKIIFLEKESNKVFNSYFENVRAYTSMDSPFAKGFMDEECGEVGITGLNVNKLTKKFLKLGNNRKFYDTMTGGRVWREISTDMINTKNKRFDSNDNLDREKKEKYLVYVLRELISGFFDNMGGDTIKSYNDPTSETGKYFNSWKLNIYEDLGKFSSSDISGGKNTKINDILLKTARNILDGGGPDYGGLNNPLEELKSGTKKNTDNVIRDALV